MNKCMFLIYTVLQVFVYGRIRLIYCSFNHHLLYMVFWICFSRQLMSLSNRFQSSTYTTQASTYDASNGLVCCPYVVILSSNRNCCYLLEVTAHQQNRCHLSFSFMCIFSRSLFVLLSYFFWSLCRLFSSIHGFWLPLWYLQTLLVHQTNDRVTRTQLNPEGDRRCSGRVISSCSTSGIRQIILLMDDVYMTVRCKTTIQIIFFNNWFYVRCTYERGTISKLKKNIVIWLENNSQKKQTTPNNSWMKSRSDQV